MACKWKIIAAFLEIFVICCVVGIFFCLSLFGNNNNEWEFRSTIDEYAVKIGLKTEINEEEGKI